MNRLDPFLQRLGPADLPKLLHLQQRVVADLPPGFIQSRDARELGRFLDGSAGLAFGASDAGQLQACALLRLPTLTLPNQGTGFPRVPAQDWPRHAAFLANALVAPAARGRGLHRRMLALRIERARATGMRWSCAGVALANRASWRNLLALGMRICGIRFDLGPPLLGLAMPLQPGTALACDARDELRIAARDADAHRAACERGYLGVRCAADEHVVYQRAL
jgi:ribosomal protein S18 acetylase RimI-like enzyme